MDLLIFEIIAVFISYVVMMALLKRKGVLNRYNIEMVGPLAFIRSTKGIGLISMLARPRTVLKLFSNAGLLLMIITALISMLLVIGSGAVTVYLASKGTLPPPNRFNEVRNIFLLPGINEFIPLLWGIVALVVVVIVHELGHAVMCAAHNIKIKSIGIVLLLFPIAAFTEPDNDILVGKKNLEGTARTINRVERLHVFASGVAANFITAAVLLSLFFILFSTLTPIPAAQGMFSEVNSIYHGILNFRLSSWANVLFLPFIGLDSNLTPGVAISLPEMLSILFFKPTIFGSFVFPLLLLLLWAGWANLMVGMFNSLPAMPLDGGFVFRDALGIMMGFFMKDEKRIERKVNVFAGVFSIWIFSSIIITTFMPLLIR